jgi:sulfinoalanine decarboxylase
VLKLWLGLRQLGMEGIAAVLDGAVARRQRLQALLAPLPLDCVAGPLHLLAFTPTGVTPRQAELWSSLARQRLLDQQLMLSRPHYAGRHHLKAVLGNPHTADKELLAIAAVVEASLLELSA